MLSLRRHHCVEKFGIFLVTLALIVGVNCDPVATGGQARGITKIERRWF